MRCKCLEAVVNAVVGGLVLVSIGDMSHLQAAPPEDEQAYVWRAEVPPQAGNLFRWVGDRIGYMSRSGMSLIPERYIFSQSREFEDGFAVAQRPDKVFELFDRQGKVIIESPHAILVLGEGRFAVQGDPVTFIDLFGQLQVRKEISKTLAPFQEGLLPVEIDGKWGFLDERGRIAIAPMFDFVLGFAEGTAPAFMNERWGYIDATGEWRIQPQFEAAQPFSEGLAVVRNEGKVLYILPNGQPAFKQEFADGSSFSEGLAVVHALREGARVQSLAGYINHTGQWVIPPQYVRAGRFSDGLAVVTTRDGATGYINRQREMVIRVPDATVLGPFYNGLALVQTTSGRGYLNKHGEVVRWTELR